MVRLRHFDSLDRKMECQMENVEIRATEDRTRLEGCFTMPATQRRPKPFKAWFVIAFPRPFAAIADGDQGQMGALSALMAIGLFDMSGGAAVKPAFDLTAPLFDQVTIRLNPAYHPGGSFHIVTRNQHPDHVSIHSATLDGQPWNSFQLPHDRLIRGGTLELVLGPKPNKA